MSIHIDKFEEEIHFLIAERGKEYFDAHQVLMLQQTTEDGQQSSKVLKPIRYCSKVMM